MGIGQDRQDQPKARQALLRQVGLILAESQAGELVEQDRQSIQSMCAALQRKLAET